MLFPFGYSPPTAVSWKLCSLINKLVHSLVREVDKKMVMKVVDKGDKGVVDGKLVRNILTRW